MGEGRCVCGGGGGRGGDQFESPVEIHSIFFGMFFFACVVVFYGLRRGGGKLLKLFVSLNRILKAVQQEGVSVD